MITTKARRIAVNANRGLPMVLTSRVDARVAHAHADQQQTLPGDLTAARRLSMRKVQELLDELASRGPAEAWWDEIDHPSQATNVPVGGLGWTGAA